MKLFWIYWILLLISIISSGLLFIIVASEGISKGKIKNYIDNVTLDDTGQNELFHSFNLVKLEETDKSEEQEYSGLKDDATSESGEAEITQIERLNIVKESLTQQPNLSQGISETGQTVVLTLVDTASAELQSLADPQRLDKESRGPTGNSTDESTLKPIESETTISVPVTSLVTSLPSTSIPPETAERNASEAEAAKPKEDEEVTERRGEEQPEEKTKEEVPKVPDEPVKLENSAPKGSTQTELDESLAKAKVGSGSSDEAAAAILDNLVISSGSEPHEDIPSFSEWAQKRLEEAEKKKTHPNVSIQNPGSPGRNVGMKIRSKNYASVDCGAKIVGVNPEAGSAKSILLSNRDEYMLNTCTSRIWFVVELCEAIQAKKIELANFELFSSSPKDFSVYISDRYPTRDWSIVGQFTGKDERDIQSFQLNPHLFGKFIKIELHSHYGSEHFCPISLFRAYGTSEFEVLDTENEVQENIHSDNSDDDSDDDEDNEIKDKNIDNSRNLFGSATDAVIRIVKKAAEVLVKSGDDSLINNTTDDNKNIINNTDDINSKNQFDSCISLKYDILCNNCTNDNISTINNILSCRYDYFQSLYDIEFIRKTLNQSDLCKLNNLTDNYDKIRSKKFIKSFFSQQYIILLCNILAINHKLLNTTLVSNKNNNTIVNNDSIKNETAAPTTSQTIEIVSSKTETLEATQKPSISVTCLPDKTSCFPGSQKEDKVTDEIETVLKTSEMISQIRPTKTLTKEDVKKESSGPILEPSKEATEETMAEVVTTPSPQINVATASLEVESSLTSQSSASILSVEPIGQTAALQPEEESVLKVEEKEKLEEKLKEGDEIKLSAQEQMSLDSLLSDLESDPLIQSVSSISTASQSQQAPQQKESVFIRLSNRIKALERNMSLSGQYLEELSRRYKKQVEEMQRSLERAITTMNDEFKRNEEKELKRNEELMILKNEISSLTESLENLLYDRNSWRNKFSTFGQHIAFIFIEVIFIIIIIFYCRKNSDIYDYNNIHSKYIKSDSQLLGKRRSSVESIVVDSQKKQRRPSEIAAKISGTYNELMIDEGKEGKKKKKRKRESVPQLSLASRESIPPRRHSSNDPPTSQIVDDVKRPESAPSSANWSSGNQMTLQQSRKTIDEIDSKETQETGRFGILKSTRFHSPNFMRTALKNRSKRDKKEKNLSVDNSEWDTASSRSEQDSPNFESNGGQFNGDGTNGVYVSDSESDRIATPLTQKKIKKEHSLKKMVKKLF